MGRFSARTYQPPSTERTNSLAGLPLASFWSRLAAFLIDMIFVIPLAGIVEISKHMNEILHPEGKDVNIVINPFHGWEIVGLVAYMAVALYLGKGRTVGKKLLRIRVVSLVHDHMSLWHCVERTLGYGASALEGGFGFLQYFIHPNRQTVHDRIAETIVVKEPRKSCRKEADLQNAETPDHELSGTEPS